MKFNIAVAGGIGSGKSIIVNMLKLHMPNIQYFSVDDIVADMWRTHEWQTNMIKLFGHSNKREISKLVFSDVNIQSQVEELAADYIERELQIIINIDSCKIIEFPLLFERNMEKLFDLTILIIAPLSLRVKRVMERDNKSEDDVMSIISAQMDDELKKLLADIIVINDDYETIKVLSDKLTVTMFNSLNGKSTKTVTI